MPCTRLGDRLALARTFSRDSSSFAAALASSVSSARSEPSAPFTFL